MTTERWPAVERLFLDLLDKNPAERRESLREMERHSPDLAAAVQRLLAAHERSSRLTVGDQVGIAAANDPELAGSSRAGERLGAYELIEEIGRGGMATVYRAKRMDDTFDRDVAVKVLRASLEEREVRARFRAEQQILAGLEHPSIARLYDGGVTGDQAPYLVLELIDGQPIDAYCEARGSDLEERLRLFRQVCDAVAFAHQRLVVHRDLKPSNILVDRQGEVRLLDFGIAKLLGSESSLSTLTRPDFIPLTPRFASPEQLLGEPVTTASDVYSLGVLLCALTTGSIPFADTLADRLKEIILEKETPKPSEVASGAAGIYGRMSSELRGDLDAIIQKALRADREARYQTVEELLADLGRARRGEAVLARQGNWVYLSSRWVGRNRVQLAAVALLLTLATLWSWSARQQAEAIRRQRDVAELEAAKATQTSEYLVGLFESAAPSRTAEADVTARELLSQGAQRARRDLANQPDVQAVMLYNIGRALQQLGLPSEALPVLEEALAIQRREQADDETVGRALAKLASVHLALGHFAEASAAARGSIELCRGVADRDPSCLAAGLQRLGQTLSFIGEFEAARSVLDEALGLMEETFGAQHPDTLSLLNSLGMSAYYRSDWEQAVDYFSRAQGEDLIVPSTAGTADEARNANAWGAALLKLGRAEEALRLHQQAFEALSEIFGPVHENVAGSLSKLGMAQLALGDLTGGEASFRQAVETQRQLFPPGHPRISFTETGLAQALAAQGRLAEAERLFADGVEGMRRTVPDLVQRAEPLMAFGRFLMQQGRYSEAMVLLVEARAVAAPLPPGSDNVRAIGAAIEECQRTLDAGD